MWSLNPRAIYRWKDETFALLATFLTYLNGTTKASLREMEGLVHNAWRPINRKYAHAPEWDPADFLRENGRHVHWVPTLASPLTRNLRRRGLPWMHPSTLGLHG